ncbi:hypothetical protein BG004_001175 [Podila humilis]|nr:hypothetical protein BG004_001175 [Podila humilis]
MPGSKDTQESKAMGPSPIPRPSLDHVPDCITTNPGITSTRRKSSISQVTVDELGDMLQSASVDLQENREQRRKQNYKSTALVTKTQKQSQEERRRQALAEQEKKRYQFTNHARKLALFSSGHNSSGESESGDEHTDDDDDEGDNDGEEDMSEDDESKGQEPTDNQHITKKSTGGTKKGPGILHTTSQEDLASKENLELKHKRRLSSGSESEEQNGKRSDQLMMPEVMTEIPIDLDVNYYVMPLPIGHRCYVISADGKTTARLPSGQLLAAPFESCLPAGSTQYRGNRRSDYCILDCVYSSVTRTFWTMDIMCWRGHPVYECETEFRFWWLHGKLAEIEALQEKWVLTQTREWKTGQAKKQRRLEKQAKYKQEKVATCATEEITTQIDMSSNTDGSTKTSAAAQLLPTSTANAMRKQFNHDHSQDYDNADDEADLECMDTEDSETSKQSGPSSKSYGDDPCQFWPIVFTPLPYFNASIDLVRLLAESMHRPGKSVIISSAESNQSTAYIGALDSSNASKTLLHTATITPVEDTIGPSKATALVDTTTQSSLPTRHLGTMALSGEIATAASLFPAHDYSQKARQDKTLCHECAAGLVFFNKKTMYVLGTTPLCGWVAMNDIGDVFFDEEGGVGPVPGTSAVEGREVEMEDALERIRI